MNVVNDAMVWPRTRAHLLCVPWQDEQAIGAAGGQRAENLRLLAAHHVVALPHAGDEVDAAKACRVDKDNAMRERRGVGGAGDIGRLDPARARADHAGADDRQRPVRGAPLRHDARQRRLEQAGAEDAQAFVRFARRDRHAAVADEGGAQPRRAPVDADQTWAHVSGCRAAGRRFRRRADISPPA
jgi:hypothetical protein